MKKLFMFAALAALTFVSCTREVINGGDEGNIPEGNTYASFSFNGLPETKALGDFNPLGIVENDAADGKIDTDDLYLLVFNGNALEYYAKINSNPHTALVSAGGNKKIFVLANMGSSAAHVNGHLVSDALGTATTTTIDAIRAAYEGSGYSYSEFMNLAFDAGTPQANDVDKANVTRSFSVLPLSTRIGGTQSLGLPMTSSNQLLYTFAPNITNDNTGAEDPGVTPTTGGTSPKNRFLIQLDYMGAKARMTVDLNSLPQNIAISGQPRADISLPKYTIKNLAKLTGLVQNVVSGSPRSIYYNYSWGGPSGYINHIDQASNVLLVPDAVAATTTPFIFVPENNNSIGLSRGQSSFYELNVTYKPRNVANTVVADPLNGYKAKLTTVAYSTLEVTGSPSETTTAGVYAYVYITEAALQGDMSTPFFANPNLLARAYWMNMTGKDWTDAAYPGDVTAITTAFNPNFVYDGSLGAFGIAGAYKTFTNAQSWYRLDIGVGTGSATNYGVLRSNAYSAKVTDIAGPGEPSESALFKDPDAPVVALTYINVTIQAATWKPLNQENILK